MNFAFFLRSKAASSLHSWACRLVFGPSAPQAPLASGAVVRLVAPPTSRPATPIGQLCVQSRRPLRVVRVMESGQPCTHGGRMVISGRMADVCAELDRLAAREAADNCGPRGVAVISA